MLYLWSKCQDTFLNAWRIKVILILSLIYPGLYTSLYGAEAVPPHSGKKKNVPCECATLKKKKKKMIKCPLGLPSSWENVVTIYVSRLSAQWCPAANSWCSFYVVLPLPLKAVHHCINAFVAPDGSCISSGNLPPVMSLSRYVALWVT